MFSAFIVFLVNFFLAIAASSENEILSRIHFAKSPLAKGMFQNATVSFKPSLRASTEGTTRTLIYQLFYVKECAGNSHLASGIPFGVCLNGYSNDGKLIGSGLYNYVKEDNAFTYTTYSEYKVGDCNGSPTQVSNNNYPKGCHSSSDAPTTSLQFHFIEGTDVSPLLKNGILYSYYDQQDHCTSNAPSTQWTFVALNFCLKADDGQSIMINGCSANDGKYSAVVFSDAACSADVVYKGTQSLATCVAYPDGDANDSGFRYNSFESQSCL